MTWTRRARLAAALTATGVSCLLIAGTQAAGAAEQQPRHHHPRGDSTFAVIGDIPYGAAQIERFPRVIDQLNADRDVSLVAHLGDIKDGSSPCSDDYYSFIRSSFDRFADPLVYSIGDNEWTDCHRPADGSYDPLERLTAVRSVFFDHPGRTLGRHPARVDSQADRGLPENVSWHQDGVGFASVHLVGSNNALEPWIDHDTATPEQAAEVLGRTAGDVQLIDETFEQARRRGERAVVLLTQADMFDPTVTDPQYADYYAFTPVVREIARQAAAFGRPVYLFNGDSHVYNSDQPLATGSHWLSFYGVERPADNLRRLTVDGSTDDDDYLKVTVHRRGPDVLTWERVPFVD